MRDKTVWVFKAKEGREGELRDVADATRRVSPATARAAPRGAIGCLDDFIPPGIFYGWGGFQDVPDETDVRILVKLGDEIVAEGPRAVKRKGLPILAEPAGFWLSSSRAITHEQIASGKLSVEVRSRDRSGLIVVPDHIILRSKLMLALRTLVSSHDWTERNASAINAFITSDQLTEAERAKALAILAICNNKTGMNSLNELACFAVSGVPLVKADGQLKSADDASDVEVLSNFESIGRNCEFGFIQRHFKYEPISLLRWADMPFAALLTALRNKLEGVGDPKYTIFAELPRTGEYFTGDSRYHLRCHTFVYNVKPEKYQQEYARHSKRLAWLRNSFVEALQAQTKVLVRVDYEPLTDQQINLLFDELNAYGRNKLLVVRADPDREERVERVRSDLFVGYIKSFSRAEDVPKFTSPDSWMKMLRIGLAMVNSEG